MVKREETLATRDFLIHDEWRTRDYSDIQEIFVGKKSGWSAKGTQGGGRGLLVLYTILVLPLFLLIVLMLVARKSTFAKVVLYLCYGFMIIWGITMVGTSSQEDSALMFLGIITIGYTIVLALISKSLLRNNNPTVSTITYESTTGDMPQHLKDNKVFGVAGDLSSARGKFSDKNIELGEEGEFRTAEMLNDLLTIPGTRVFHGVHWPGSRDADIDHIAINGRKIALIDSKMWSGSTHTITSNGSVSSSQYGATKPVIRKLGLPDAIVSMSRHMNRRGVKKTDMYGWLAIHKLNGKNVKVNNKYNPNLPVTLGDAKDVVNSLGTWFADEKKLDGTIHQDVVDSIFSTMK